MAEAAGFVLAALPLIIEGLRGYLKGVESIKKWWQYSKVLKRLIRKFLMEQRKLVNTCTELLEGLVDDCELGILLKEPGGANWQEKTLQIGLRRRLGGSFQVFFDAVSNMTEVVEEFEEKLELDQNHKPRWLDYSTSKREWKRVLFSLSEPTNDTLIQRLEQGNKDIGDLLGHSLRMETLRVPKAAGNAKYYDRIHECAKSLYNTLKQTFMWPCGCPIPHKANLRLEMRDKNSKITAPSNVHFHVLFSFDADHGTAKALPWNWCETRIERIEHNSVEATLSMASLSLVANSGRKKVAFASTDEPNSPTKAALKTPDSLKAIDCLCTAMNTQFQKEAHLGILVDEMQRHHRITIKKKLHEDTIQTVSLKSLLKHPTQLEKRDRLALGVKLASTLLQLHRTPWLQDTWGKRDITFLKPEGGDHCPIVVQTPLIAKHFSAPTCKILPRQLTDPIDPPSPEVRNQSIFALGVILIELWYNQPIETLRTANDCDKDGGVNQITEFATARRLTEEIYREAGDWYGDAVRRCVYCEFDQRHNDLGLSSMKEAVHQGVLAPLQENLQSFCGGKVGELLA